MNDRDGSERSHERDGREQHEPLFDGVDHGAKCCGNRGSATLNPPQGIPRIPCVHGIADSMTRGERLGNDLRPRNCPGRCGPNPTRLRM